VRLGTIQAVTAARFKDLVLDAVDAARLGAFWGCVLDREWHAQESGDGWLSGPTPQHTLWINQVPEPLAGKNRVHFDVYAASLAELEGLGATVVQPMERWTVMADPEGTLFCAMLRDELPADRMHGLVVDSIDPVALGTWWGRVYETPVTINGDDWATLENVPGVPIQTMDFTLVPEVRTVKNRIHWDVVSADPDALVSAGATLLRARDDQIGWHVLADPEGNEFCVFDGES
jgi:hypothetical protein